MSDQYKQEKIAAIESKIREFEAQRRDAVGRKEAAEQAARRAASDIEAADQHLQQARAELEEAKLSAAL